MLLAAPITPVLPHRFSVAEYERLVTLGAFGLNERIELVEGEIVDMAAIGWRHGNTVSRTTVLFARLNGPFNVHTQGPVTIGTSQFQPDLCLLSRDLSLPGMPQSDQVLLVIEVADSSLPFDLSRKLRIYASLGVPEYWVCDLTTDVVMIHTEPVGDRYLKVVPFRRGERARAVTMPGIDLAVDDMLAAPDPEQ